MLAFGPDVPMYPGGTAAGPLPTDVMMALITQPNFDSKHLGWVLEQNSPLPGPVLDATINRNPPMKISDLNRVLGAQ